MTSEQIREMLEAATPGPWSTRPDPCHYDTMSDVVSIGPNLYAAVGGKAQWQEQEANARLIAAAPDLAAEVLRLRDELASGSFYKESDIDAMQDEIARLRGVAISTAASLAAAISLLERGGKAAKKAAPSDNMFDQMLTDYRNSLDAARAALGDGNG